jgi:hypothetical protein
MTSPITPPPELVEEWANDSVPINANAIGRDWERAFATRAAQWGADQELEACIEWIPKLTPWDADKLRAARRPKPPSLKEQALNAHNRMMAGEETQDDWAIVRRALEDLPE